MNIEDMLEKTPEYKGFKEAWQQYSEDWGHDEACINPDFFQSPFYEKIFNFLIEYKFKDYNQGKENDLLIVIQELDWITNKKIQYEQFFNLKNFLDYYFN